MVEEALGDLEQQWRAELTQLVVEMASGDARMFPDRRGGAEGAYAPATRVYERLAL